MAARDSRLLWVPWYDDTAGREAEVVTTDPADGTALVRSDDADHGGGVSAWLPLRTLTLRRRGGAPGGQQKKPRPRPTPAPTPPPRTPSPPSPPPGVSESDTTGRGAEGDAAVEASEAGRTAWRSPRDLSTQGGERIRDAEELRQCALRAKDKCCWVALRVPASHGDAGGLSVSAVVERGSIPGDHRVLCVAFDSRENWAEVPYTVRTLFGTYVAAALDGKVSVDRKAARSFEHFSVVFKGGKAMLKMRCAAPICKTTHWRWLRPIMPDALVAEEEAPIAFPGFELYRVRGCDGRECHPPWYERPVHVSPALAGFRMLVFTTLKPRRKWSDEEDKVARRALHSWRQMRPWCRTVVFSEDEETRAFIEEQGIKADGRMEISSGFGVPTYRGMFARADELALASEKAIAFVNGDILFTHSLAESTATLLKWKEDTVGQHKNFMFVGRRFNAPVAESDPLDSPEGWQQGIEGLRDEAGREWQEDAIDYFVVSRGIWDWAKDSEVPAMVIGGTAFDNWVLQHALDHKSKPVVADMTRTVTAVHQGGIGRMSLYKSHAAPQSEYNKQLGQMAGGWARGKVTMAPYLTLRIDGGVVVHRRGSVLST
eukprot:Hpha_TRINITY_DN7747_c0_g1::TRINITY_DN7747_c0_g1_i2::g.85401::m.85401